MSPAPWPAATQAAFLRGRNHLSKHLSLISLAFGEQTLTVKSRGRAHGEGGKEPGCEAQEGAARRKGNAP